MSNITEEQRVLLLSVWKYYLENAAPAAPSPPKSPAAPPSPPKSPAAAPPKSPSPPKSLAAAPSPPKSPAAAAAIPSPSGTSFIFEDLYESSDDDSLEEGDRRKFVISLKSDLTNLNSVSYSGRGEEFDGDDN